jgi:hypothetical protein
MKLATHDHPLPGDLVVREVVEPTGVRSTSTFIVTTYPQTHVAAGPYQSLGYAIKQARALAGQRGGLLVWREENGPTEAAYEDVTELARQTRR